MSNDNIFFYFKLNKKAKHYAKEFEQCGESIVENATFDFKSGAEWAFNTYILPLEEKLEQSEQDYKNLMLEYKHLNFRMMELEK